ncbi:MAG: glycosyltransferase [Ruminococcus sp.]|jgi:glycosyltransferase involved in cell wall biosynthesis|nr:glycosyltransferase [Ruminococcus sp.]
MCCSVIVPVYNVENYLDRCLQSIVEQTYEDIEIILINDGSTDGSDELCRRWVEKDNRIVFVSQENIGIGLSRNRGIELSNCEYITFVDSDDRIDIDYIEKMMSAILNNNADIVISDMNYVDVETGKSVLTKMRFDKHIFNAEIDHSVVNKSRLFIPGKIYKKSLILDNHIFCPDLTFEDTIFPTLAVMTADKICYVEGTEYNYFRNRKNSVTSNPNGIIDADRVLHLLKYEMLCRGFSEFDLEFKKIALGQLRFFVRKFENNPDVNIQFHLDNLYNSVGKFYAGLNDLKNKKFFVCGDELLHKAADVSLPSQKNITDDRNKADEIIKIPKKFQKKCDTDFTISVYNLAELIMEDL